MASETICVFGEKYCHTKLRGALEQTLAIRGLWTIFRFLGHFTKIIFSNWNIWSCTLLWIKVPKNEDSLSISLYFVYKHLIYVEIFAFFTFEFFLFHYMHNVNNACILVVFWKCHWRHVCHLCIYHGTSKKSAFGYRAVNILKYWDFSIAKIICFKQNWIFFLQNDMSSRLPKICWR